LAAAGLGAVLFLVGALTLEVWRTARLHEAVARAAVRDWTRFAASTYKARIEAHAFNALARLFRPIDGIAVLPPLETLIRSSASVRECRCAPYIEPQAFFRVHLVTGAADVRGQLPSGVTPGALAEFVIRHVTRQDTDGPFAVVPEWHGGDEAPLIYTSTRGPDGRPAGVYGRVAEPASFEAAFFGRPAAVAPLLPTEIGRGVANDSIFSIAVRRSDGTVVYGSMTGREPGESATARVADIAGGYEAELVLDRSAMERMLLGGVPRSPLPLLLAVDLLALALVAATVALVWRGAALGRLRTEFIASVSHDLRTPLAQILLYAETMSLGRLSTVADYRREANVILQQGRSLLHLVENVLHFARSERTGARQVSAYGPVAPPIEAAIREFAPMAAEVGMRIDARLDPDVVAPLDSALLQRAVRNLLDNAARYAASGDTVHIALRAADGIARITVEDCGPGIPPADRVRVWRPFVRLGRDVARDTTGSGLGLAIVRDVMRRCAGEARIEEPPSGGVRVVLEWPGATLARKT
jgi:signal transduction histidine kinase